VQLECSADKEHDTSSLVKANPNEESPDERELAEV
jgi:hypothetical protein